MQTVGRSPQTRRAGKIMIIVALLLSALVGMLGLVVDTGSLLAAHRQSQNAADGAAQAGAAALLRGTSVTAAVQALVASNGVSEHNLVVNSPPQSGNYVGNPNYVEVVVTYPVTTNFIQVLGVNKSRTVTARAVAGWENVSANLGVIQLNPTANPGLSVTGQASLGITDVSGKSAGMALFSLQSGNTQIPGVTCNIPGCSNPYACQVNTGSVTCDFCHISGGIDTPSSFNCPKLNAGTCNKPCDPLGPTLTNGAPNPNCLPTPTVSNGVAPVYWCNSNCEPSTPNSPYCDPTAASGSGSSVCPYAYYTGTTWCTNRGGNCTSGSTTVTFPSGASIGGVSNNWGPAHDSTLQPGVSVYGCGIPKGCTIASVDTVHNTCTLSAPCSGLPANAKCNIFCASSSTPTPCNVSVSSSKCTIPPGVYGSISVSGSGDTTFGWSSTCGEMVPGGCTQPTSNIYVCTGHSSTDLSIGGTGTITGSNMMFYNTGTTYDCHSGDNCNSSTKFGSVIFTGSPNINYSPCTSGTFQNVLFYQCRNNSCQMSFNGNEQNSTITGTLYCPNGQVALTGQGRLYTQVIAGSVSLSGQSQINVHMQNAVPGTIQSVFLVE
jgi:Flp pilus assembly protein TadG